MQIQISLADAFMSKPKPTKDEKEPPKGPAKAENGDDQTLTKKQLREAKLAEALRANLRRRKE